MGKEVEIKLSYSDKDKVVAKIESLDFKKTGSIHLEDHYYDKEDQGMESGRLLRIRREGKKLELTLKIGKLTDENIKREEYNVQIKEYDIMNKILLSIGFEKVKENESRREIWNKDDIEFCFIEFLKPAKLKLIEIEGPDEESVFQVKEQLGELISVMDLKEFKKFD